MKGFEGDGELAAGLRRLARHLPVFEAPGFEFGSWEPARKRADGVIVMGWYVPGPEAEAFLADLGGWITPFDWMSWASSPAGAGTARPPRRSRIGLCRRPAKAADHLRPR